jgi:hypothetical protein
MTPSAKVVRAICTAAVLGILAGCSSKTAGPSGSPSDGSGPNNDGSGPDNRDNCVVDLSAIVDNDCAASFEAALAGQPCSVGNPNHPASGECGGFLVFSSGHDGSETCIYDPSTHALVGGTLCGIPPFYSPSCSCTNAGMAPISCAAGDLTPLCNLDGGSVADH